MFRRDHHYQFGRRRCGFEPERGRRGVLGVGIKGNIDAVAKFNNSTVSVLGLGSKNVTVVTINPQ